MGKPAGFWIRLVSHLIDTFIFFLINFGFSFLFKITGIIKAKNSPEDLDISSILKKSEQDPSAFVPKDYLEQLFSTSDLVMTGFNILLPLLIVIFFLRKYGATPGKLALELKVINVKTKKNLSVVEIILREFIGKSLMILTLGIGYIFLALSKSKRGLHDYIGRSQVIYNDED